MLERRWAVWLRVFGLAVWVEGAWVRDREMMRGTKGLQGNRPSRCRLRQAEAIRSHTFSRLAQIVPVISPRRSVCTEKHSGRREDALLSGDFLLGLPMWRSLIILQGVLPGKGNKSDRGTGGTG